MFSLNFMLLLDLPLYLNTLQIFPRRSGHLISHSGMFCNFHHHGMTFTVIAYEDFLEELDTHAFDFHVLKEIEFL